MEKKLSNQELASMIYENLTGMLTLTLSSFEKGQIKQDEDSFDFVSFFDFPTFNGVVSFFGSQTKMENSIHALQTEKVSFLCWDLSNTKKTEHKRWFQKNQLIELPPLPSMFLELNKNETYPLIESLEFIQVTEEEDYLSFIKMVSTVFGFPSIALQTMIDTCRVALDSKNQWFLYVVKKNREVIGTSCVYERNGVAGIYNVTVGKKYRKQGIGKAITQFALVESQKRGNSFAILNSTPEGYGIYKQLGFQESGSVQHFLYMTSWWKRIAIKIILWAEKIKTKNNS